ncbi:MAG: DUF488 family protein [Promethearchaeota archaeon]
MKVFSIGYAAFSFDEFVKTLQRYKIGTLVDVRSIPYSKISPMFTKNNLTVFLPQHGINYLYLGHLLGGKAQPSYPERIKTDEFRRGIEKLENITKPPPAIMCVEPAEQNCHRSYIMNYMHERGHEIVSIVPSKKKKSIPNKQTSLDKFLE